jgi:coenzyme F420 hydrogenase subunit beta
MKSTVNNVNMIVKQKLCLGCGTCDGICPSSAINMIYSSKNRTYIPTIDKGLCINCGLCYKVCPGFHIPDANKTHSDVTPNKNIGASIKCFIGHSNDNYIRYRASSGGIATALSTYLLECKKVDAVVATKMDKTFPFDTKPIICRSYKDLLSGMGSKYCPAATNSILKKIEPKSMSSIAFTGLPCHIQGIKNSKRYDPIKSIDDIFTIGLLCGGMKGQEGSRWILKKHNISMSSIQSIKSHRGHGWPGKMTITLKNSNEKVKIAYPSYFDDYFESWQPWRCFLCLDRFSKFADISLGDAWLSTVKDDSLGSSLIIARTKKGLNIINGAIKQNVINATEIEIDTVLRSQDGLMKELDRSVKPTIYLSRYLCREIPDHGIQIKNPGWKILFSQMRTMSRFVILRRMTTSDGFLRFIRLFRNFQKKVTAFLE